LAQVLLVTGTPGTGKTLVGTMLAEDLGCRHVSVSKLAHDIGVAKPDPSGRLTSILDQDGAKKLANIIKDSRGCIVLETVTPRLMLEAGLEEDTIVIILLRAHPEELCRRLSQSRKTWPEEKILENCAAEAFNSIAEELLPYSHDVIEIDTTRLQAKDILELLYYKLVEWRTGIEIDWLTIDPGLVEKVTLWLSRIDFDKYRIGN